MTQQPGELRPGQRIPPEGFPTGPEVGEAVPDFTLQDQHGREVTFSEARAGHRALLVFHRSARW